MGKALRKIRASPQVPQLLSQGHLFVREACGAKPAKDWALTQASPGDRNDARRVPQRLWTAIDLQRSSKGDLAALTVLSGPTIFRKYATSGVWTIAASMR